MENLKVFISFQISEKLSKITVSVENLKKNHCVNQVFDLLPGYPLDNYVKYTLTLYNMTYGTQENPPQNSQE